MCAATCSWRCGRSATPSRSMAGRRDCASCSVAAALDRNEPQLKGLITNLRIVTGSFAAQDRALRAAIRELPGVLQAARPTFANLNAAFPFVRAFAHEARPGVRS